MSLFPFEQVEGSPGGVAVSPLPLLNVDANEVHAKRRYLQVVEELTANDPMSDLHLDIVKANLDNRFKHIRRPRSDYEEFQLDYLRLNWTDHDTPERIAAYVLKSTLIPSLEVSTYIEAGSAPHPVPERLSPDVVSVLRDLPHAEDASTEETLRVKVTRLIGERAAVITTKLDGYKVRINDAEVAMKTRRSGFVLLDDLSASEQEMAEHIASDDFQPEEKIGIKQALTERPIFHPTVSVLYLCKKSLAETIRR